MNIVKEIPKVLEIKKEEVKLVSVEKEAPKAIEIKKEGAMGFISNATMIQILHPKEEVKP